jgi:hypothetical protein
MAVVGVLVNPAVSLGAEPNPSASTRWRVPDVRLDPQRRFHGAVVDGQGKAVGRSRVTLVRSDVPPPTTTGTASSGTDTPGAAVDAISQTTDAQGRFTFADVSAGTYRLETDAGISICRLWTHAAAPPAAASSLLVVNDARIERGQRPIRDAFYTDPLLMAVIVGAAIAIPIAVHKSRDESPEGS